MMFIQIAALAGPMLHVLDQPTDWKEINVRISGKQLALPPFPLGRSVVQFRAVLVEGRFTEIEFISAESFGKPLTDWLLIRTFPNARVVGNPSRPKSAYQLRLSDMGTNDFFPAGYSFWVPKK